MRRAADASSSRSMATTVTRRSYRSRRGSFLPGGLRGPQDALPAVDERSGTHAGGFHVARPDGGQDVALEPQARFRRYHVTDTVVFFGSARAMPPEEAEKRVREAGSDPAAIRFHYGAHGKPSLPAGSAGPAVRFNFTNSDRRALLAVAVDRDIGIDLEGRARDINLPGLVRHILNASEAAEFRALPAAVRHQAILTIWTRKEAWIKALGEGLSRLGSAFIGRPMGSVFGWLLRPLYRRHLP